MNINNLTPKGEAMKLQIILQNDSQMPDARRAIGSEYAAMFEVTNDVTIEVWDCISDYDEMLQNVEDALCCEGITALDIQRI